MILVCYCQIKVLPVFPIILKFNLHPGLKQCGSLNLAQTKDRMIALKRRIAYSSPTGLHCEVL